MRHAVEDLLDASQLDDEELQIAIRLAYNNLKDRKDNFNEFIREGAPARIIQYSNLSFLFAQIIVAVLNAESDHRFGPDPQAPP